MSRRVVESLSGVGEIYSGGMLLRSTPYRLSVFREVDGDDLKVDGHIDITGIGEAVVLAGAPILTLRLSDGRQLQFRLTDTGGTICGTSGIQPA